MRYSDFGTIALGTAAGPALYIGLTRLSTNSRTFSIRSTLSQSVPSLRLTTFLGLVGGFLIAYQNSSLRFWGWKENSMEAARDFEEMHLKAKNGEPFYGESQLDNYMQGVASRNSRYSALNFAIFPWFNFVNHKHHGVDTGKYHNAP